MLGYDTQFTTIVTAVFPAFFASYAAAGMSGVEATSRFACVLLSYPQLVVKFLHSFV